MAQLVLVDFFFDFKWEFFNHRWQDKRVRLAILLDLLYLVSSNLLL